MLCCIIVFYIFILVRDNVFNEKALKGEMIESSKKLSNLPDEKSIEKEKATQEIDMAVTAQPVIESSLEKPVDKPKLNNDGWSCKFFLQ